MQHQLYTEHSVDNWRRKGDVMKKLSTVAIAAALTIGSHLSMMQNAQAFSFGSFNMGDSWGDGWGDHWGDGWGNSWGDNWQTNPRWSQFGAPRYGDPRWNYPRWRDGNGWGNGFSGPRFNFGDGDGFRWGNRSSPRWGSAPRWVAPPPWAYPPYYVAPATTPQSNQPAQPESAAPAAK